MKTSLRHKPVSVNTRRDVLSMKHPTRLWIQNPLSSIQSLGELPKLFEQPGTLSRVKYLNYLGVAPKSTKGQISAADHQKVTVGAGKVSALGVKHTVAESNRNKMVFLTDARRLSLGEALLISIDISNYPNVATASSDKAVLNDVRLEERQAQSVSREHRVLPSPLCG
jgi:hypothetical protein